VWYHGCDVPRVCVSAGCAVYTRLANTVGVSADARHRCAWPRAVFGTRPRATPDVDCHSHGITYHTTALLDITCHSHDTAPLAIKPISTVSARGRGCSVVGVACDIQECCGVVCDDAGVAVDLRGGAWPSAKYGTRPRAAVPSVCTHTRSVCQSSVDSAGCVRGDMGCDRHWLTDNKRTSIGRPSRSSHSREQHT